MRQRVSLTQATFRGDVFISSRKRHRLERDERDLFRIVHGEPDDRTHLVVIDAVDQCDDEDDLNASLMQVIDGLQLHVEQVADLAMAVRVVADAVKLKVGISKAGFCRFLREFLALGEFDTVGCRLHAGVTQLAGISHCVAEIRRHGRFAAGELDGHLPPRLDADGVVHNFFYVFP